MLNYYIVWTSETKIILNTTILFKIIYNPKTKTEM